MKIISFLLISTSSFVYSQTLLFKDTFNAPDTGNLDLSGQTERRTGLQPNIQVRSSRVQHGIAGNQLNFLSARTGRIRFHEDTDNDTSTGEIWNDWASETTGPEIISGGGLRLEFDWIAGNDTSNNWVSINMGISGPAVAEPAFRVNNIETDIGMLFRFNGETELFDNGTNLGAQGTSTPTIGLRHVVLDYSFASFEDGSDVSLIATVDGAEVYNGTGFTWDNNLGELYFEIGTLENTLIDNVAISALTGNSYFIDLEANTFSSGLPQNTSIGDLSATLAGNLDNSTFTFIAGDGDTDNDKFQLNGSTLEVGNFDFTGANSVNGQEYSVRIAGTGTESTERIFTLVLTKDDDSDNLTDDWEMSWAGNLSDLSATAGTEDFDLDGLTDAAEFNLSTTYPNLDPTKKDSDEDTLADGEEVNPTGTRPATDPTNFDTDLDTLSDAVETNSGTFIDANDTGTNPTLCDTDGDFATDSWEITYKTNPLDSAASPSPIGPVAIVPITDNASTGLDPAKTYTHLISGGASATVNGVTFDAINASDPPLVPTNFGWDTFEWSINQVVANNGDWDPFSANVSADIEALLGSFIYSGTGAGPGNSQRYTLSNLNPGSTYDLRIYSRIWDTEATGRPSDLVFTNGTQVVQPFNAMPLDRPGILTKTGNDNDAYYLTFQYTAQTTELVIDATIPACAETVSGSFHLYALSNEVANGVPLGQIIITLHSLLADGRYAIGFKAKPQTAYKITKSSNLAGDFLPLDPELTVTTDINGDGQAIITATETTEFKEFYRIEE